MSKVSRSVLIPRTLDETDLGILHQYMDSISISQDEDTYWVRNLRSKTCKITLPESEPFVVDVQTYESDNVYLHDLLFEEEFGFLPRQFIYCGALCSGDMNGRILDEITLTICELFGGIVDFERALMPPIPPSSRFYKYDSIKLREKGRWSVDFEPAFREMVKGMPGRIVGIPLDGMDWVSHYADAQFLRASMIKQYPKVNS